MLLQFHKQDRHSLIEYTCQFTPDILYKIAYEPQTRIWTIYRNDHLIGFASGLKTAKNRCQDWHDGWEFAAQEYGTKSSINRIIQK